MFQAIYRRMRPTRFHEIVGQDAITVTIKNQIISGRTSHAYLFCGTRGTGKTSTAKVLSSALCCHEPVDGEPCGVCSACVACANESNIDIMEFDAASNSRVDDIRSILETVPYPPQMSRRKVYILDEVHNISNEAFNALLKTLEEPPEHVVFILATTEPNKLLPTILSRCQRFDFRRIPTGVIADQLKKSCDTIGASYETQAIWEVARAGEGSMRDAQSILDLCVATGGGHVSGEAVRQALGSSGREFLFRFADACADGDMQRCYGLIDELMMSGRELAVFMRELCEHMRMLLVADACGQSCAKLLDISDEDAKILLEQSKKMGSARALRAMELLSQAESQMGLASQPRVLLELAVIKICNPETQASIEALLDQVKTLEKKLASGQFAVSAPQSIVPEGQRERRPSAPQVKKITAGDPNVSKAILSALRKKNQMTLFSTLRMGGTFIGVKDGVARYVFPHDKAPNRDVCMRENNRKVMLEIVSEIVEGVTDISFEVEEQPIEIVEPTGDIEKEAKEVFGDKVEVVG
ncbi:MAG: DNA polymerase III subunit gamma/tau [Clostridia bacterium]|nr:DNA polymerase III subunit gamma/tau [Clostridia bacterium]